MQWDGNLTEGGSYLDALTLLNLWIQLGNLSILPVTKLVLDGNSISLNCITTFFLLAFDLNFTGWPYPLQI